jgi:tetratricopeptide (TPR) repeat protein
MMKRIFNVTILIFSTGMLYAQSTEQGNQQLYYERYQSAENTFHQVLKSDAGNGEAWYALSKAYLLQGKAAKAADSILLAPASVQDDPYYKVARGLILLQQGKSTEAGEHFTQALKATKEKNPEILSAIAWSHIYADAGDANYAVELLNKAVKRDKHNPALYVQSGDAWRKLANSTEGYKAYQKAIEEDGKYALAHHRMGEIFLSQKNKDIYVDYFKKAIEADPLFAPSLYKLYVYEFGRHPDKSMQYYKDYLTNADLSVQNEYDMTDLLYINRQYDLAIEQAKKIITNEGAGAKPRLYKLIGYSLAAQSDTSSAISYMRQYFMSEADSNFISKDYEIAADLYAAMPAKEDSAMFYYENAVKLEKDKDALYGYYKKLSNLAKAKKDYVSQAVWLGKYYSDNEKASNLDLFNWGIALYRTENYIMADSVFGLYTVKFPEQTFGYYWQARSKSLLDKEMKEGLAVPAYEKLIGVLQKDTANANYKKWIIEAYGYLASYQANAEKDYDEAIEYFQQILQLDPDNEIVKKNVEILEKELAANGSK